MSEARLNELAFEGLFSDDLELRSTPGSDHLRPAILVLELLEPRLHGPVLFQVPDNPCNRGLLLSNGDIDADHRWLRTFLVDDCD